MLSIRNHVTYIRRAPIQHPCFDDVNEKINGKRTRREAWKVLYCMRMHFDEYKHRDFLFQRIPGATTRDIANTIFYLRRVLQNTPFRIEVNKRSQEWKLTWKDNFNETA